MPLTTIRWKRWLAGAAGLLAAYAAAGFWLVPLLIKQQAPQWVQTELARAATIGEVRFNPFTLRLQAQQLRLSEAAGAPLLAIGQLTVQLQWQSLFRRAWSFAEIRVTAPHLTLAIAPDGRFNLAQLLATLERRPPDAGANTGLPRLIIERLALEQGTVELDDQEAGYANRFTPIDFAFSHFSTLPEQNGSYSFSADSARGGQLRWKGELSVNPIRGSGELSLINASLPELAVYLKAYTRTRVTAGRLDITLPYRFSYRNGQFAARLSDARLQLKQAAVSAAEDAAQPALALSADNAQLQLQLTAEHSGSNFKLTVAEAAFSLTELALTRGTRTPFKLARLGFDDGALELAARRASLGRFYAEGGQLELTRARSGQFDLLAQLSRFKEDAPATGPAPATPGAVAAAPWLAVARQVQLSRFGAALQDQGSGIKLQLQDVAVKLDDASSDLTQPVKFQASLGVREGGALAAHGSVAPASGALQAQLQLKQLALAPLQPLLGQYLKLKIASGQVSAQGQLTAGSGQAQSPALRYVGSVDIARLGLNEESGEPFAAWKSVRADQLSASFGPNRLQIPELRVIEPNATLIIEDDRSFNAARLLVRPDPSGANPAAAAPGPAATGEPFPVRIQRVRVQNAKLDFTDLSLRPQFGAKIYALNGVINGLSSDRTARSQLELDGRVDEFGLARIRGELNPFAPRDNTDINLVFKNVDMVSASPYSMKFAGYRIAQGKISLDLQYRVRASQLEGANQIVIDHLTLGERVDSPNALKLPLELAIALLKDSDGRIDLGLPISGDMSNPQFSYGAIIWKAIGNVLGKIVSAPFRALGSLLGISGEKLETIDFDAGSERLLPPEREKLKQVAQLLAKRPQLKLSVPGHYSETADGAALKARALRVELAGRAGIQLVAGEEPGPLDLGDQAVRDAVLALFAERFGQAELTRQKKAAEGAPPAEDASPFYRQLQERLAQTQPLAAEALPRLGAQRADAIVAALKEAGAEPASVTGTAPEPVAAEPGQPVRLKLGLAAK